MKQALFAGAFSALSLLSFSQANTAYRFGTTGSNVIAYKQGTSCTAGAYSFYLISDGGVQAPSPFYTLNNTGREVNGIGINPVDRFLYGIEYDRDASCVFSDFHLKRYDAQGGSDDLGTLPAPAGGTVTAALGCVTANGNFVYSVKDASGASLVCLVSDVTSLPANSSGTLSLASSKQITNNAGGYIYADWAVHPTNGNIYTYGIANVGGVSTGRLLVLDPATGLLQSTGAADGSSFLDAARDNFGGVYFGSDGMLYGVNVNTRKLYKINPFSGATAYVTTLSGSGQIRADMGSYTSGWTVLPVNFTAISLAYESEGPSLRWSVAGSSGIKQFTVELNSGEGFRAVKNVALPNPNGTSFSTTVTGNTAAQYRVKAVTANGDVAYSPVVLRTAKDANGLRLLNNPVRNAAVQWQCSFTASATFTVVNANGQVMKKETVPCVKGSVAAIAVTGLRSGVYLLQSGSTPAVRFVIE